MSGDKDRAFAIAAGLRQTRDEAIAAVRDGSSTIEQMRQRAATDHATARVFAVKLYEVVPGAGKVVARRAMEAAGIDEAASIGDVTDDQAAQMRELLSDQ